MVPFPSAATFPLLLWAAAAAWAAGQAAGGAVRRRWPGTGGVLLAWALLGTVAGAQADAVVRRRPAGGPTPPREVSGYYLIEVSGTRTWGDRTYWEGSLWAWTGPAGWRARARGLQVGGTGDLPSGSPLLVQGAVRAPRGPGGGRKTVPRLAVRRVFLLSGQGRGPSRVVRRLQASRRRLALRWASALGEDAGRLASWALLGERAEAAREWRAAFERTGTLHLLAISGLHLALLGGWVWFLVRLATGGAPWARWVAIVLLGLYGLWVGSPPSVLRAWGMLALVTAGPRWGRGVRVWNGLGWVVALLPVIQPALPAGAAFRLSVSATAGVLLGTGCVRAARDAVRRRQRGRPAFAPGRGGAGTQRPAHGRRRKKGGGRAADAVLGLLGASAGATLLTVPWSLHHFGRVYPLGLVVNLVAVPAMALVLPCLLLAGAASALGADPAGPWVLVGRVAGESLLRFLRVSAEISGRWPLVGGVSDSSALAMVLAVGGGLWLLSRLPRARNAVSVAAAFLLVLVPLATARLLAAAETRDRRRSPVEVTFLDVGQGDAILVRLEQTRWLFDLGPGFLLPRDPLVPQLLARGVRRVQRVWISHGDTDHWGGLESLLASPVRVDSLILPSRAELPDRFWQTLAQAPQRPVVLRQCAPWTRRLPEGGRVTLYHPLPGVRPLDRNDSSFVLGVRSGDPASPAASGILLVGDLETPGERRLLARGDIGSFLVVQAGHHGSRTSGSAAWYARIDPRVVVASLGAGNRYGFPHRETMESTGRLGAALLRTDREGAITIYRAPAGLAVSRVRPDPSSVPAAPAPSPGVRPE